MSAFSVRRLALISALRKVSSPPIIFNIHTLIYTYFILFSGFLLCFSTDCTITKFLNRILGLEVLKQNSLFQYFSDNFDYLIEKDKKEGKYDMGILGMSACNFVLNFVPSFKELSVCNAMCPLPVCLQIWLLVMMRSPTRLKRSFGLQATHKKAKSFSIRSVWIKHSVCSNVMIDSEIQILSCQQNQNH